MEIEKENNEAAEINEAVLMRPIAYIRTDFPEKFGIPRQSGLAGSTQGRIIFEKPYRREEAVKGLEGYSHIWLLWYFSLSDNDGWLPMVRPPRLGGKIRMGVFATRSPNRPNPIGLSSVELSGIEYTSEFGPVLHVKGADMVDKTPIFDIKPYVPLSDSHPAARGGFSENNSSHKLEVVFSAGTDKKVSFEQLVPLTEILSNDPRPAYHDDTEKVYGLSYGELEIKFRVDGQTLYVCQIE